MSAPRLTRMEERAWSLLTRRPGLSLESYGITLDVSRQRVHQLLCKLETLGLAKRPDRRGGRWTALVVGGPKQ